MNKILWRYPAIHPYYPTSQLFTQLLNQPSIHPSMQQIFVHCFIYESHSYCVDNKRAYLKDLGKEGNQKGIKQNSFSCV